MANGNLPSKGGIYVGRVLARGTASSFPVLKLEMRGVDNSVLGHGYTGPRGDFAVELRADCADCEIHFRLLDRRAEILAEGRSSVDEPLLLRLPPEAILSAESVPREERGLTLLPRSELHQLRYRIESLVSSGELSSSSLPLLNRVEESLQWFEDLLVYAELALAGNDDAAARLRYSLVPLGISARSTGYRDELTSLLAAPQAGRAAVTVLSTAALWASEDSAQAQLMLDGLAAGIWQRHWLQLLFDDVDGIPAATRVLMSAPQGFDSFDGGLDFGPSGGLGPDIHIPGRKIPGIPIGPPSLEGWKKGPPRVVFDPFVPGGARLETPVRVVTCVERTLAEASRIRQNAPRWNITSLSNRFACHGAELTLFGSGFGSSGGTVAFTGAQGLVEAQVLSWTDTAVTVEVPDEAAPGAITLHILEANVKMCDAGLWPVFRLGTDATVFVGGTPLISGLFVSTAGSWSSIIAPDTNVQIDVSTSTGDGIVLTVEVFRDGAVWRRFQNLKGGSHSLAIHTPATSSPIEFEVVATVANFCGTSERRLTFTVGRLPQLHIRGVELVQTVQSPDPTTSGGSTDVRLVARKRTLVRVYVESGVAPPFSWGDAPGEVPITGTVNIFTPTGPVYGIAPIARLFQPPAARTAAARDNALEFELPWDKLVGNIKVDVTVRAWNGLPSASDIAASTASLTRVFEPRRAQVVVIRMVLRDEVHPTLSTPTPEGWRADFLRAKGLYPVAEDAFIEAIAPGLEVIATGDRDLNTEEGWNDQLEELDEIASEYWDPEYRIIWAAAVPDGPGYRYNGIAHNYDVDTDFFAPLRGYPADYRALLFRTGRPTTFAHEMGHTFALGHAGCPRGKDQPEGLDSRLPDHTEPGSLNWRAYDGAIMLGPSGELMSYCGGESRMPSVAGWNALFDLLTPP